MQRNRVSMIALAPIDQYLAGRDAEIALARSAAPPSVVRWYFGSRDVARFELGARMFTSDLLPATGKRETNQ